MQSSAASAALSRSRASHRLTLGSSAGCHGPITTSASPLFSQSASPVLSGLKTTGDCSPPEDAAVVLRGVLSASRCGPPAAGATVHWSLSTPISRSIVWTSSEERPQLAHTGRNGPSDSRSAQRRSRAPSLGDTGSSSAALRSFPPSARFRRRWSSGADGNEGPSSSGGNSFRCSHLLGRPGGSKLGPTGVTKRTSLAFILLDALRDEHYDAACVLASGAAESLTARAKVAHDLALLRLRQTLAALIAPLGRLPDKLERAHARDAGEARGDLRHRVAQRARTVRLAWGASHVPRSARACRASRATPRSGTAPRLRNQVGGMGGGLDVGAVVARAVAALGPWGGAGRRTHAARAPSSAAHPPLASGATPPCRAGSAPELTHTRATTPAPRPGQASSRLRGRPARERRCAAPCLAEAAHAVRVIAHRDAHRPQALQDRAKRLKSGRPAVHIPAGGGSRFMMHAASGGAETQDELAVRGDSLGCGVDDHLVDSALSQAADHVDGVLIPGLDA
eukprot:scaffold266534_cov32-Tisochrysis_lutea.AAC.2